MSMQFSKIDEKTIRCFVTLEELESQNMEIEDLFQKSERQQQFFGNIVKQARDLMGFVPPDENIIVNVLPVEGKGIVVTLSEDNQQQELVENFMEATRSAEQYLKQQLELLQEARKEPKGKGGKEKQKRNRTEPVKKRVYGFDSLHDLEEYCHSFAVQRKIKSSCTLDETTGRYFLTLEKGRMGVDAYNAICNQANDFAVLQQLTPAWESYEREHYRMLIPKYAVNVIHDL